MPTEIGQPLSSTSLRRAQSVVVLGMGKEQHAVPLMAPVVNWQERDS